MLKKLIASAIIILLIFLFYQYGRSIWYPVYVKIIGKKTVAEIIAIHKETSDTTLLPLFTTAGINYPPKNLALVAFKQEKILEVWASNESYSYQKIVEYPIQAASGTLGPKLREGDRQVPEGMYRVIAFNPNSSFHLSMKLNYPNQYDLKYANTEGRTEPGTNIFIHGEAISIGCLAMGNEVIETLFTLVHETGQANTLVIISPTNPNKGKLIPPENAPAWTNELYKNIGTQYYEITK